MNKVRLLYPCLALIFLLGACSHELAPQNHFQSSPVTADGVADDWSTPLRYSNNDYTLSYNITNDAQNIYVCVITKDDEMQRRILKAGINIYFDPKAGKNKTMTLAYPLKNINRQASGGFDKNALLMAADTYNTIGFLNMENGLHSSTDNKSNLKVAIRISGDSSLVYEAVVPVNAVLKDGLTKKSLKKNFSIGIVVANLPESRAANGRYNDQRMAGGGARMQPRIGMGGGGMRGMGMGGGMRGGGGFGNRTQNTAGDSRSREEALWNTFSFADKQ